MAGAGDVERRREIGLRQVHVPRLSLESGTHSVPPIPLGHAPTRVATAHGGAALTAKLRLYRAWANEESPSIFPRAKERNVQRTKAPYRADQVGSFLRSEPLKEA